MVFSTPLNVYVIFFNKNIKINNIYILIYIIYQLENKYTINKRLLNMFAIYLINGLLF